MCPAIQVHSGKARQSSWFRPGVSLPLLCHSSPTPVPLLSIPLLPRSYSFHVRLLFHLISTPLLSHLYSILITPVRLLSHSYPTPVALLSHSFPTPDSFLFRDSPTSVPLQSQFSHTPIPLQSHSFRYPYYTSLFFPFYFNPTLTCLYLVCLSYCTLFHLPPLQSHPSPSTLLSFFFYTTPLLSHSHLTLYPTYFTAISLLCNSTLVSPYSHAF